MKQILSTILLSFVTIFSLSAQVFDPVKWTFSTEKINDTEYKLIYTAKIDKGWTVYSQYTSDDGPVPTEIVYESMDGIDLIGKGEESGEKKEGFDKLFEVDVIKYKDKKPFVITQKIRVKDASQPISGYLTFMTCDNERCLPPTDVEFSFTIDQSDTASGQGGGSQSGKDSGIGAVSGLEDDEEDQPSGILDPIKWSFKSTKTSDSEAELVFTADIEKGWNVYSQYTEEGGPYPTEITFEESEGVEMVGKSTEDGYKKEGPDKLFEGVNVIKFTDKKPFTITQKVKITDADKPIKGYLTFMTCNDVRCLTPKDVDFSFSFSEAATAALNASNQAEEVNYATGANGLVDQRRPSISATYKAPLSDCGGEQKSDDKSLFLLFLAGMLGGFAALLTPCVFPMIPITVSFFTKDTKRKGWMNGLIYGASIIVIYVVLGLLITIFLGPEALNALSTNWIANVIFFLIFIVFAFSFFGYYEITLPSSWSTKSDQMADKGGLIGIFFMAATLALVSFSCTGPIVGSALVAAAKGGYAGPLTVMLGFSLALALPFGLFAAFPAWLNSLPRSGGWMNSVKVVLGFLEVAFAFKFLSTADLTQGWGFLRYELFMAILIITSILIAIYLFGFIKFPHDSKNAKIGTTRKIIGGSFAALAIYLCFGFTINKDTGIYNSLWLTSGFSPPVNYNYFLEKEKADEDIKAKYPSFTKCANNIDCFKDYYEGLAYAKEQGKPLFVDFTGHGCQNCRRTEDNIWVDPKVKQTLNDDVVLVSLYVDERKDLKTPFVSAYDSKKKRTVGAQWADFQVVNFEQNSQPLYIMMTTDEEVITRPRGYEDGIESYQEYLDCGLDYFKSSK